MTRIADVRNYLFVGTLTPWKMYDFMRDCYKISSKEVYGGGGKNSSGQEDVWKMKSADKRVRFVLMQNKKD